MKNLGNDRPRILAVDGEHDVLTQVTTVLSRANFACSCCTTSQEALEAVQTTPPDLILCDVNLHGESGIQLSERIRQQPGMQNVPVMFLSGMQLPDVVRRSHAAGGTYCLRKPLDSNVLLELIDQALTAPEA